MANILVVGGTGFIGRHLVPHLCFSGHEVMSSGRGELHKIAEDSASHIIVAAGSPGGEISAIVDSNVVFASRLSDHLSRLNNLQKVYLLSSMAVYGEYSETRAIEGDGSGDHLTTYGASMLLREKIIQSTCADIGVSLNTLRLGSVYGEGAKGYLEEIRNVSVRLHQYSASNLAGRSTIHISDVVEIVSQLIARDLTIGVLNICSAECISPKAVYERLNRSDADKQPQMSASAGMYMSNKKLMSILPDHQFTSYWEANLRT